MGNHEYCVGCGQSDFHIGRTCQEAYPLSFKLEEAKRKEAAREQKLIPAAIKEVVIFLKLCGIPVSSTYNDNIAIYGFDLVRAGFPKINTTPTTSTVCPNCNNSKLGPRDPWGRRLPCSNCR